jgi:hypothetical protein
MCTFSSFVFILIINITTISKLYFSPNKTNYNVKNNLINHKTLILIYSLLTKVKTLMLH